jgi:hypothetical protein
MEGVLSCKVFFTTQARHDGGAASRNKFKQCPRIEWF